MMNHDDTKNEKKTEACSGEKDDPISNITVGSMVEVARRMWPGINRPGGAGRVTRVYYDHDAGMDLDDDENRNVEHKTFPTHVNVHYVVEGGSETRIPIEYVKVDTELDFHNEKSNQNNHRFGTSKSRSLRNRGLLLGRCKRCGSLRKDCGSCDLFHKDERTENFRKTSKTTKVKPKLKINLNQSRKNSQAERYESSSSEDTDDLIDKIQSSHRKYRRKLSKGRNTQKESYKKFRKSNSNKNSKHKRYIFMSSSSSFSSQSSSSGNDSESDDDSILLSHLFSGKRKESSQHKNFSKETSVLFKDRLDPLQSLQSHAHGDKTTFRDSLPPILSSSDSEEFVFTQHDTTQANTEESVDMSISNENTNKRRAQEIREKTTHSTKKKRAKKSSQRKCSRNDTSSQINFKDYIDPLDNPNDTFIQPEGEDVAENLPKGQNDRTISQEYKNLPSFFDALAHKIEEELLPNAKFRLLMLEDRLSQIREPKSKLKQDQNVESRSQIEDNEQNFMNIEIDVNTFFQELRETLVLDGLDQCRKCLKRIQDEYRRHRKHLTKLEKRQLRGITMETRDFRMLRLEDEIEAVLKKARLSLQPLRNLDAIGDSDDDKFSSSSGIEQDDSSQSIIQNSDLNTSSKLNSSFDYLHNSLPPYDPHQHATKVRKSKLNQTSYSPNSYRKKSSSKIRKSYSKEKIRHRKESILKRKRKPTKNILECAKYNSESITNSNDYEDTANSSGDNFSVNEKSNSIHGFQSTIANEFEVPTNIKVTNMTLPRKKLNTRFKKIEKPGNSLLNNESNKDDMHNDVEDSMNEEFNSVSDINDRKDDELPSLNAPRNSNELKDAKKMNITRLTTKKSRKKSGNNPKVYKYIEQDFFREPPIPKTSAKTNMEQFLRINSVASIGSDEKDSYSKTLSVNPIKISSDAGTSEKVYIKNVSELSDNERTNDHFTKRRFPTLYELYENMDIISNDAVQDEDKRQSNIPPSKSISELCDTILGIYPSNDKLCEETLHWIHYHVKRYPADCDDLLLKRHANNIFRMLLKLLQKYGKIPLMEYIRYRTPKEAILHGNLLKYTFMFLESKLNNYLSPEDGLVYIVFKKSVGLFIDEVTLQIIDFVYSQILPDAWEGEYVISADILKNIKSLSHAVSKTNSIMEKISRLILSELKCQNWKKTAFDTSTETKCFISCIDQNRYSKVLNGEDVRSTVSQGSDRFKLFKTSIPRLEIEAIWTIFAYFNSHEPFSNNNEGYRWRILISLFLSVAGVLGDKSSVATMEPLPPSKSQLTCCALEIRFFSILLKSGNFNPLPGNDVILEKLLSKSIALLVDSIRYDFNARDSFLKAHQGVENSKTIRNIWDSSDLMNEKSIIETDNLTLASKVSGYLSDLIDEEAILNYLAQAPHQPLLRSCLALCLYWGRNCIKKARKIRFERTMSSIIQTFKSKAESFEEIAIDRTVKKSDTSKTIDEFSKTFVTSTESEGNKDTGSVATSCVYRIAAGFLFFISNSRAFASELGTGNSMLDLDFYQKAWALISGSETRKLQESILKESPYVPGNVPSSQHPAPLLLSAAKLLSSCVDLFINGAQLQESIFSKTYNRSEVADAQTRIINAMKNRNIDILKFLLSCMSSCLEHSSVLLQRTNDSLLPPDCYAQPTSIICERVVTRICCLFCKILMNVKTRISLDILTRNISKTDIYEFNRWVLSTNTNVLHKSLSSLINTADQGDTGDVCLRAQLSLLRCSIKFVHYLTENIPENSDVSEDPFGGIDDDAFLNIDIESLVSKKDSDKIKLTSRASQSKKISLQNSKNGPMTKRNKFDHIIGGDVWKMLILMLKYSCPSMHYKISENNQEIDINSKLCERQRGGICASLASMCTLPITTEINLRSTFEMIFSPSNHFQMDSNDKLHFKALGQYFSSVICDLAKSFQSCKDIVQNNFKDVFGHFMEALLDSSIIDRFPTSNFDLVEQNGGQVSVHKKMLEKVSKSNMVVEDFIFDFNDKDAERIARRKKTTIDSPGNYLCKNIWTFCSNLGKQMKRFSGNNKDLVMIETIGKILVDTDLDLQERQSTKPLILAIEACSIERECFKRFMKVRGFLTAVTENNLFDSSVQSTNRSIWVETLEESIILMIKTLLEQTYFISDTVKYFDRVFDGAKVDSRESFLHSHKRSKAYALQKAYIELLCACLSFLLCNFKSSRNSILNEYVHFVRDKIISPILLKQRNFDFHVLMNQAISKSSNPNKKVLPFDINENINRLYQNRSTFKSGLNFDLHQALCAKMPLLTMHVAFNKERGVSYNALMDAGLHKERNLYDDFIALNVGHSLRLPGSYNTAQSFPQLDRSIRLDPLRQSINTYLQFAYDANFWKKCDLQSLGELRHFALHKYFLPRLRSPKAGITSSIKIGILKIFMGMFANEDKKDKHGTTVPLTFLDFSNEDGVAERRHTLTLSDLCSILRSIIHCLRNELRMNSIEDRVIEFSFELCKILFQSSIEMESSPLSKDQHYQNVSILEWMNSVSLLIIQPRSERVALYLKCCFEWLIKLGEIIISIEVKTLYQVIRRLNEDGPNSAWSEKQINLEVSKLETESKQENNPMILFLEISKRMFVIEKELYPEPFITSVKNKYTKQASKGASKDDIINQTNFGSPLLASLQGKAKLSVAIFVHQCGRKYTC